MVAIDYFTKIAGAEVLPDKYSEGVVEALEMWVNKDDILNQLITDNGKIFMGLESRKMRQGRRLVHRTVRVESHRRTAEWKG